MRRRFDRSAIASSDGIHCMVNHDRRANTTGRTNYTFCGKDIVITNNNVYDKITGAWMGHLYIDDHGEKHVYGPLHKGLIKKIW